PLTGLATKKCFAAYRTSSWRTCGSKSIEGPPFTPVFTLEISTHKLPFHGRAGAVVLNNLQSGVLHNPFDLLEVLEVISDDLQPPHGQQSVLHQWHELVLDQPSLVMPLLRPRVGEINVQDRNARRRHKLGKKIGGFSADRAGVKAVVAAKAVAGIAPEPA